MKPEPARVLQGVGMTLVTSVLGEIKTAYGQQTVTVAGGLVFMVADEFDRAADRLVVENAIVRDILADALSLLSPPLVGRVEKAIATRADSYKVSALQAENDALRGALVDVHAAVDAIDSDEDKAAAQAFGERIWAELVASTRRREFATRLG
jgi:hypothetical protein